MKKVSIKDLAREAGVSTSTVSFVLNGKASQMRISEEVTQRILAIAKKLGYVPNQVAISLRTGQSKTIGLIVESISGHFFGLLAKVIEQEAEKSGYRVIYSSTENKAEQGLDVLKTLSQQQVDGYLLTPAKGMEDAIKILAKQKKPVVLIDSYFSKDATPHVLVDNYKGVQLGMKHLKAQGYRDIGLITVDIDLVQIEERKTAFVDAMKAMKQRNITNNILVLPYHSTKEEMLKAIGKFLKERPGMEALFFATNYLGVIGLEYIQQRGWKMPDDLAMICFDDQDVFRLFPGGISVIRQPVDEIGKKAITILLKELGKEGSAGSGRQFKLQPQLIVRGST